MTKRKKRILDKITLSEISAVGVPAQEGATLAIMKNSGDDDVVTSIPDETPPVGSEGSTEAGTTKNDDIMTPEEIQKLQDDLAAVTQRADRAEKLSELNDAQREFHKGLSGDEADAYLTKSDSARQSEVDAKKAKAAEADPVIYTADNGIEFRKSDDPRLVKMAEVADKQAAELKKARAEAEQATFAKQAADDLGNAKGSQAVKVAVLRAIAGIEDADLRKEAVEMLKAADGAFRQLTESVGHTGADNDTNSPEAQLDALAKSIQERDGVPFAKAYDTAIQTAEGESLYAKVDERLQAELR